MEQARKILKVTPFSLRGRLLFLTCLASMPAILFTFFSAKKDQSASLLRGKREALQLVRMASREHSHQIKGAREILFWLGGKISKEGRTSPVLSDPDFLKALLAGHPQLSNIGVLSTEGEVLTSAYPLSGEQNWRDNPAYKAALLSKKVEAGSYLISPIFDRPTLNHAFAVRNPEDQVIAVLFDGLNLGWLKEMTQTFSGGDGLSILIADRQGSILASSNGRGKEPSKKGLDLKNIPDIQAVCRSADGVVMKIPPSGSRYFVLAAPLEETEGLFVVAALPYFQVMDQANSAFYHTLLSLGLLIIFTITAVFIATELGVLRGIHSLSRATAKIGAGNLLARARIPQGSDEFASLAIAFNSMAESLEERHKEAQEAQEKLRALATRLQDIREKEAARISRELHDEMAQSLTSLKIDLSRLQFLCDPSKKIGDCHLRMKKDIAEIIGKIDSLVDLVRQISSDLRPGVLDRLGLTAALQWQAEVVESKTELSIQVEADENLPDLNETVSLTLFRITQEALTNVIRHAQATMVEISLHYQKDRVILSIKDDGVGISLEDPERIQSLGIIGMKERAMVVEGSFSIVGTPQKGTHLVVSVPVDQENPEKGDSK